MEFDVKLVLSLLAVSVAIVSYVPYLKDIFKGKTKPHAFSWLIWALLNGIAFFGQLNDGGGVGSWAVGFTALATFFIFFISLFKGEKDIRPFDWFCLLGALLALIPWLLTNDPLISIIVITVIDIVAFLPTFRKSFHKPFEETLLTYSLSVFKYSLVTIALQNYSLITLIFPLSMVIINLVFVIFVISRRAKNI